jgi:hypothetical protein
VFFYVGTFIDELIGKGKKRDKQKRKEKNKKEERAMKITVLSFIIALGLLMPLYWIIGSLVSAVYVGFHGLGAIRKEQTGVLHPRLGLTMADGGKPVKKEKK